MRIKQDDVIKRLHSFTKNIIQRRRSQLIQEIESNEKNGKNGNTFFEFPILQFENQYLLSDLNGKMALLDILLQSTTADGKSLSNEDIREEVDTFMFEVQKKNIIFIFIKITFLMLRVMTPPRLEFVSRFI